jgi:transposase
LAFSERAKMIRTLISDAQWKRIEHLLPGKAGDPGRTAADNRLFVEAVLWVNRTIPWRFTQRVWSLGAHVYPFLPLA